MFSSLHCVVHSFPFFCVLILSSVVAERCSSEHVVPVRYMSSYVLQLVHSDVWGPTRETSHGGNRYYVSFIDDYSRKTWVYFMKNKSNVFYYFNIFRSQVENEVNIQIKMTRSDGGGEYFSNEFSNFFIENRIIRQFICKYTPQHNSVVERKK